MIWGLGSFVLASQPSQAADSPGGRFSRLAVLPPPCLLPMWQHVPGEGPKCRPSMSVDLRKAWGNKARQWAGHGDLWACSMVWEVGLQMFKESWGLGEYEGWLCYGSELHRENILKDNALEIWGEWLSEVWGTTEECRGFLWSSDVM